MVIGLSSRFVGKGDLFSCRGGVVPVPECGMLCLGSQRARMSVAFNGLLRKTSDFLCKSLAFLIFFVDSAGQNTLTKKKHYA